MVTAFYRGENKHGVSEFGYQLYCRLWHYSRPLRCFWRRGKDWTYRLFKNMKFILNSTVLAKIKKR